MTWHSEEKLPRKAFMNPLEGRIVFVKKIEGNQGRSARAWLLKRELL